MKKYNLRESRQKGKSFYLKAGDIMQEKRINHEQEHNSQRKKTTTKRIATSISNPEQNKSRLNNTYDKMGDL
jgi:hypothetical protein